MDMKSFQDLGLSPELVDLLAAEGIDFPTPVQEDAIPVIRRGNNLVLRAGPGSGILVAYGVALLDRLEPEGPGPLALVATPTRERAAALAESLARLARYSETLVASLDRGWAVPERAHVLFATPGDFMDAVRGSRIKLEGVEALVVDGAAGLRDPGGIDELETLVEVVPSSCQRVLVSLPLTDEAEAFAEQHMRRAVRVPPDSGSQDDRAPRRGEVGYRVVGEPREAAAIGSVARLLEAGHRHVAVFLSSEDRAADLGDHLTLHGFRAGAPGDESPPVWLAVDDLALRRRLQEMDDSSSVATLSVDVPHGPDSLDRRHGAGGESVVLTLSREVPHLKEIARTSGYGLVPAPEPATPGIARELEELRSRIRRGLADESLAPWHLVLEPLFEEHAPAEVASALAAVLHRRSRDAGTEPSGPAGTGTPPGAARERAWVRLFLSVGKKDGVGPGDLLGAVTGEARIEGARVGKIEIRDSYSLVEVDQKVAGTVIEALNGVTIKGRSVRADYDRGRGGRGRG